MKQSKSLSNNIIQLILLLISVILFLSYFHPTFTVDEEYSMRLIQHNFVCLININMLDVHPPTYYILLKIFLNITTFWTSSFILKVMFARLFSLIFFIANFVILCKIVSSLGLHINWKLQLLVYLSIEYISYHSVYIRPYSLSCYIDAFVFYELLKFDKDKSSCYLIMAIISMIIASYVDYLSIICVGVFILIFLIKYIIKLQFKNMLKIFVLGLNVIILDSPLLVILCKQIINRQKYSSFGFNLLGLLDTFTQTGI